MTYLCGPIDFASDFGRGWREDMAPFLKSLGIGVLNPCDKPTLHRSVEDSVLVEQMNALKAEGRFDEVHAKGKEILSTDLHLVDLSTFLITFIDVDIHMCGTYCETTYAALEKKPNIFVCKQGKAKIPNWIYWLCDHRLFFSSWDEVKSYLRTFPLNLSEKELAKWRLLDMRKVFE